MKSIIGYLGCIAIAVVMAIMINARAGILIGLILVVAFVLSVFLRLYLKKRITVTMTCSSTFLSKGDTVDVHIRVEKHTRFPSPMLEIELGASPQLEPVDNKGLRFALAPNKQNDTVSISFRAVYSGLSNISITRFEIADLLGLSHQSKISLEGIEPIELKIMPRVPDTGTQMEVIKTAADAVGFDDSEEETSETALGQTGMPGYEHRVYTLGDPLKKINWKLSSKRNIYMVRLDEKLSVTSQVFVLDCPTLSDMSTYSYKNADIMIEGCLAMLLMLASQGLESDLYYYADDLWNAVPLKTAGDVMQLAERLASYKPVLPPDRLPKEAMKGASICFTSIDASQNALAAELFSIPSVTVVVAEDSGFNSSAGSLWTCSADFEFKKLN
ncbi:MAG: DUF58 domain-containing protein [Ruminococcus sp.]|nr:DUF58 domain-containing protein [Ruminococcus sp.]